MGLGAAEDSGTDKSVDDGFSVSVYVRDCTNAPNVRYHSFILPANILVDDLIAQVSERASLKPSSIYLNFMGVGQAGSTQTCLNGFHCPLMCAIDGVSLQPNNKLYFMLTLADEVSPRKIDSDCSFVEYSPQNNSCASSSPLPAIAESITLPGGDPSLSEDHTNGVLQNEPNMATMSELNIDMPPKRFVGLVNQAMTCYLNSLIQTLFMTPEFRNAIYEWDPSGLSDEVARSRSIPCQLQRLFLRLQFSHRQAVETTALTTSFGWDTTEVWEQHDVQELCRILLDALESAWRGTDKADLIDHLYQGKMEDYVRCLNCNHCSSRVVKYQDISLAIRSFDAQVSYGTLHDALAAFTKPETLTDDNRYYCERCLQKQDASKGLRFLSFPRVVTIQLKRFDFDYRFGNRVKLNDRLFFPNFINFDRYVLGNNSADTTSSFQTTGAKQDLNGDDSIDAIDESSHIVSVVTNTETDDPDMEDTHCRYELFSVLVHSGSASGGHYYAYIKSFEDDNFYCFNDRVVRRVGDEEIRLTYGSGTCTSSAYSYSTSAYMLMYRLCDKSRPKHFFSSEEMSSFPWLTKQIDEIVKSESVTESGHPTDGILSKANKYEDISMASTTTAPTYSSGEAGETSITVYYMHPEELMPTPSRVRLPASTMLTAAADIVVKELNLDKILLQSGVRYRLVPYNNYTKVLGVLESFALPKDSSNNGDECADIPLSDFIKSNNTAFFLEVLPKDLPFRSFGSGNVTVFVNLVDGAEMRLSKSVVTSLPPSWTIQKISNYASQLLSLPNPFLRMGVIERNWPGDDTIRHLMKPDSTLEREKLTESPIDMFVENLSEPEDTLYPFRRTVLYRYVDFQINATSLSLNVKLDRPAVPVVSLDASSVKPGHSVSIIVSSQLISAGIKALPEPSTCLIDGYMVKFTYSKGDDDAVVITCKADKRLTVADLAQAVATQMEFDPCTTVIWRDYGGHSEEQLRSSLCLEFLSTSSRLHVRAGRVLTENEYIANISPMEETVKKLGQVSIDRFSVVVENDWPILKMKEIIAAYLKASKVESCVGSVIAEGSNVCSSCSSSLYHLRLRRNRFGEPGRVLASSEIIGKDCEWSSIRDVFFELLTEGPEVKQLFSDLIVKARHWHPSQVSLDDAVEIRLISRSGSELMAKLAALFKIEAESIEVASCSSAASTVSLLDLHEHIRWHPLSTIREVDVYPLMLHDDCAQFYFRDKNEQLAQIDAERRRQIVNEEAHSRSSNGIASTNSFSSSVSTMRAASRPKEKSLKIYTHQSSAPTQQAPVPIPPATTPTSSVDGAIPETALMEVDKPPFAMNSLDVD